MSMDGYKFELDAAQLSDSVISSNALSIRALLARGQPLSVAVFGASVAVHGGCAHQPEAECMNYNGQVTVALGGKRPAPLKGFMVHFMEWLNSSWPHPQHSLMNLARGGTALQTALPCLFGKLPPTIDLAVLELGSMAKWLDAASIEILTRKLLALPSSPALLFVTVPMWCAVWCHSNPRCEPAHPSATVRSQDGGDGQVVCISGSAKRAHALPPPRYRYASEYTPSESEVLAACQWRFAQPDFRLRRPKGAVRAKSSKPTARSARDGSGSSGGDGGGGGGGVSGGSVGGGGLGRQNSLSIIRHRPDPCMRMHTHVRTCTCAHARVHMHVHVSM